MKKTVFYAWKGMAAFLVTSCLMMSCHIKEKTTTMEIKDPVRHYYPILRGQQLEMMYLIENTGTNPLFITDIHTSCGCVLVSDTQLNVLPPKGQGFIHLKYDSSKNTGYVEHYITIYANIGEEAYKEVTFDVHVVPDALYTKDYEEMYRDYQQKYASATSLVDGKENHKRYYVMD